MKLQPEDPRLSAYLLGELSAEEAAAVEHAIASDPALGLALQELENVQSLLTNTLAPGSSTLLPRQRHHILRAARHADGAGKIPALASLRKPLTPLHAVLASAAIIALAVFLLIRLPSSPPKNASAPPPDSNDPSGTLPLEIALLPAPGPADASIQARNDARPTASSGLTTAAGQRSDAMRENGDLFLRKVAERLSAAPVPTEEELPPLRPRGSVSALENPSIQLPVHAGRASLAWITRSILIDRKRPPASAVRTEEILNHFLLRPSGPTTVSQGVTLSTESISCPWKPSATLLLVSFRGANDSARELSATLHANTSSVRSYRLLGFAPVSGLETGTLPSRLPAKSVTSLVIEIDPSTVSGRLGSIEWSVNGHNAAPVMLARHGDAQPSADARFAALVCTYAQWLARDPASRIDAGLLAALARETAAENLPADRIDFLNLIDRSLDL